MASRRQLSGCVEFLFLSATRRIAPKTKCCHQAQNNAVSVAYVPDGNILCFRTICHAAKSGMLPGGKLYASTLCEKDTVGISVQRVLSYLV